VSYRQRIVPIDRSRLCPEAHSDAADAVGCPRCGGNGFLPADPDVDLEQVRHFNVQPIPHGHPARDRRDWVAGTP
jgi:hypothetical protein